MDMPSAFNLTVRLDNVAVITIDVPDEKMNTLKAEFGVQVRAMLKQIRDNKAIRGLVFISAKPDNFIAGADINMIARTQSALEAEELARQGQQVACRSRSLPRSTVPAWAVGLNWRWPVTAGFAPTMRKRFWACRKCSWACCLAPAERNGCRVWWASARRWR